MTYFHRDEAKKAVLALFWAYVWQPDDHIGWVTLMPFASINPTIPMTNPRNFGGNCSAFGDVEKLSFFESAIFISFFQKKKYIFCFILMKINHKLCVRMDGTQFLILWWFTAKNERGNDIIAWVIAQVIIFEIDCAIFHTNLHLVCCFFDQRKKKETCVFDRSDLPWIVLFQIFSTIRLPLDLASRPCSSMALLRAVA